jgi:16S rRNA (uracil1498-N3)-methyltransferase
MHRFFIPSVAAPDHPLFFSKPQSHQISTVLRMEPGSVVIVFDSQGLEYEVVLTSVASSSVTGLIQRISRNENLEINIFLFISLIKQAHFEIALQKCTEVGVRTIIPILCSRTVVSNSNWSHKEARWERILIEAAEQSASSNVPDIHNPMPLVEAVKFCSTLDRTYIAWENERSITITDHLLSSHGSQEINLCNTGLFIGPEGGFSEPEIRQAAEAGLIPVSLGRKILRSETAAIVGCSLLINLTNHLRRTQP